MSKTEAAVITLGADRQATLEMQFRWDLYNAQMRCQAANTAKCRYCGSKITTDRCQSCGAQK